MKQLQPLSPRKISSLKRNLLSMFIFLLISGSFWLHDQLHTLPTQQIGQTAELYSNQTNDDLTHLFSSAINGAQKSVLLVVYSLTDPTIIRCLQNKSLQGIDVKVICDATASPRLDTQLKSNSNHANPIHVTRRFGPGLMHQKILVIDEQLVWLGSANMTTESLRLHGNLVAALDDSELANMVKEKASTLHEEGKATSFPHKSLSIGGQQIEMWFLPDNRDAIPYLKSMINSAQKTVKVAMFTFTRQDLANAIIEAKNRGVKAEVVVDHHSAKGASAHVVKLLKDNGVDISISQGGPLFHHKFLYIDNQTLVNGSANWTKAAFSQNDDCFLVFHDLTHQQKVSMDTLWETIMADAIAP